MYSITSVFNVLLCLLFKIAAFHINREWSLQLLGAYDYCRFPPNNSGILAKNANYLNSVIGDLDEKAPLLDRYHTALASVMFCLPYLPVPINLPFSLCK